MADKLMYIPNDDTQITQLNKPTNQNSKKNVLKLVKLLAQFKMVAALYKRL